MGGRAPAELFRGVDTGVFAAALVTRIRAAGIEVGLSSAEAFTRALIACPPTDVSTMYWVSRPCLVRDRNDIATFDKVFAALFQDESLAIADTRLNAGRAQVKAEGTMLQNSVPNDAVESILGRVSVSSNADVLDDAAESDEDDSRLYELLPSHLAEIADTPFDHLSTEQLEQIARWLQDASLKFPTRKSRRSKRAASGDSIDLRRTLAAARSTGGIPILLKEQKLARTRRPIVMLADVSGSMERFTYIYLHLMRSLVVFGDAEVFTFATSVRRVTVALRDTDPEAAITRLTHEVQDRFGGTRIARSVAHLVGNPVWSNSLRGAVVIIASDGWDSDEPELLGRNMKRLGRLAHRVIWVNPRSAAPGFEPTVRAMAVALEEVDEMVSGHSLRAVHQLLHSIASS